MARCCSCHSKAAFETVIERHLLAHGYLVAARQDHAKANNPTYAPIVLEGIEEDAVQVIADLVEVIGTEDNKTVNIVGGTRKPSNLNPDRG